MADLTKLTKLLALKRMTVEEKADADELVRVVNAELAEKDVYVKEPDDVDDEVNMVFTEAQLKKLLENAVVAIANDMGIDASVSDKKADTIKKILDAQAKVQAQ